MMHVISEPKHFVAGMNHLTLSSPATYIKQGHGSQIVQLQGGGMFDTLGLSDPVEWSPL